MRDGIMTARAKRNVLRWAIVLAVVAALIILIAYLILDRVVGREEMGPFY